MSMISAKYVGIQQQTTEFEAPTRQQACGLAHDLSTRWFIVNLHLALNILNYLSATGEIQQRHLLMAVYFLFPRLTFASCTVSTSCMLACRPTAAPHLHRIAKIT